MLLSMIALDRPEFPPPPGVLETLASMSVNTVDPKSVKLTDNSLAFPLGDDRAAVAAHPMPIPWANLDGPCETAWWWPEARMRMDGHRSHLLVALAGEGSNTVQRALALTRLVAAVAAHVEAVGIIWGGGGVVNDPRVFLDKARQATLEKLPLDLWIDFRIEPNEDRTLRLFTSGMRTLGKMEIEIPASRHEAAEVFDFARAVADYVLSRGQ